MNLAKKLLFLPLFFNSSLPLYCHFKHFTIVVPSYNNEKWCIQNLQSIFSQDYTNYTVIYINDASKDNTGALVQTFLKENNLADRVTYIENTENKKALYNIYQAVWNCPDDTIICLLDGDDFLPHAHVLSYLNTIYQDDSVWITYGQFSPLSKSPRGPQVPYDPALQNIRKDLPNATHLKTFYAGLFKLINPGHLIYRGNFYPTTYDIAIMLPMLEMAGSKHFRCLPETLYIYNDLNPLNDHVKHAASQFFYDFFIRNLEPYQPLERLSLVHTSNRFTLVLFVDEITKADALARKVASFKRHSRLSNVIIIIDEQNDELKKHSVSLSALGTIIWYDKNTYPYAGMQTISSLYNEWYQAIINDTQSNYVMFTTLSAAGPAGLKTNLFNQTPLIVHTSEKQKISLVLKKFSDIHEHVALFTPLTIAVKKELFTQLLPGKYYINSFLSLRAALESRFSRYPAVLVKG